jgi:large subunit ribosomal protein L21
MYAILRTGGRQFRVEEGRTLRVPRIDADEGSRVELPGVLLLSREGEVTVGAPVVEGARVVAQVTAQGRERKLTVFKYKSKVRYRRKRGHRQRYTELRIERILAPGETLEEAAPARQRRKAAEASAEKPRTRRPRAAAAVEAVDAPAEERPKRTRAKKTTEESPDGGEA